MGIEFTKALVDRFFSKVDTSGDCWNWIGNRNPQGYGRINISKKLLLAHRVSYEYAFGAIAEGLMICHHCDNPSCVRPEHLFAGTLADNMRDMVEKGRSHGALPLLQGEGHSQAKLTAEQVRIIRTRHAEDLVPLVTLSSEFKVSVEQISRIVRGQVWKHLETPKFKERGRKLTEDQVRDIIERYRTGGATQRALAQEYGVSQCAIHNIVSGKHWVKKLARSENAAPAWYS